MLQLLTTLLPLPAQPYAKAAYPFLLTILTTVATALITGINDAATLHVAVEGLALTALSWLIPNGDGLNLLPAALKPYAKAFWAGAATLVTAGVGLLFGIVVDGDEIRTVVLGLVLTALTLGVPNETPARR
jgi:hypothetical protein